MIKISKNNQIHHEKSFGEKISNHIFERNLLGYKSDHEISFDSTNFENLLANNKIPIQNWLQINSKQNELDQLITHPSYQFN